MRRLEFSTLLRRIADGLGVEAPAGAAPAPATQRRKKMTMTTRSAARQAEGSLPSGPHQRLR